MSDTTPAPEGHDAKMAAAFDAAQTVAQTPASPVTEQAPAKPEWLPEKFWKDGKADTEALAKSYGELEKVKSKAPEAAPEVKTPEQAAEATPEQGKDAVTAAGLDYDAISTRFQAKGELASEDRAALNKAGIPDAMIDAYVAGQVALADNYAKSVYDSVGGPEKYKEIVQWAGKNLNAAEIAAYDKAVDSGNADAAKLAVQGLKSRFEAVNGLEPSLVVPGTSAPTGGSVFRSSAEVTAAMSDPRYKTDPAYRNDVIQKLNRSDVLG